LISGEATLLLTKQCNAKRRKATDSGEKREEFNNSLAIVKGSSHTGLYAISIHSGIGCLKIMLYSNAKLSATLHQQCCGYRS
jgi:hypothetical protein